MQRNNFTLIPVDPSPTRRKSNNKFFIFLFLSFTTSEIGQNISRAATGDEAIFDPHFLHTSSDTPLDLSVFNHSTPLQPGNYLLGVILNERKISMSQVVVKKIEKNSTICLSPELVEKLHIKSEYLSDYHFKKSDRHSSCQTIEQLVPAAQAHIDIATQQLIISIPQAALSRRTSNDIDPSLWDRGINALLFSYDANYYQSSQKEGDFKSFYNGDNIGINLHGFMLRHRGSLNWQQNSGKHYRSQRNYVEHDIAPLKARVTLGDADTSGNLFDSFSFRGIMLASDDNMLPDSQRGYAPIIRGVAQTNAHVTVRQNNSLLYETTVPPGPFSIDDLYPTGYGGDISVTVRESDGRENQFTVPYAAIAQLVRPGMMLYSLTAGTLRNINLSPSEKVAQATLQRGISNHLTGYGGLLSTRYYHALLLGGALGTPYGAIALDATQTHAASRRQHRQGQSYRLTWSKLFNASNSTVSVAAWRLSSSGYLSLNNAVRWGEDARRAHPNETLSAYATPRSRISVSLSQGFHEGWGQLYLSAIRQSYWQGSGNNNQLQAGYSNNFGSVNGSLSVNRVHSRQGEETQYTLGLSVPLGSGSRHTSLNVNVNYSNDGLASLANINSSLGEGQQLEYTLGASHDRQQHSSASAAASWHTPVTTLQGSYERGSHSDAWSAGMNGAVAVVSEGIVASPWYSKTMALVSAPGASGAYVEGHSGLQLNAQGHALVPYLVAYRQNEIALNPQGLPQDVELKSTLSQTVPHSGALVKVDFATRVGRAVLIHVALPAGQSLPFGASVRDAQGQDLGMVAQGDMIYVRLPEGDSRLEVISAGRSICMMKLSLSKKSASPNGFAQFHLPCQPGT